MIPFLIRSCYLTAFFLAFSSIAACAQDTLITVKGNVLPVKLLEINKQKISYQTIPPDSAFTIFSLDLKNVFIIKFQNGTKQVFAENLTSQNIQPQAKSTDQLQTLGKADARKFYDPKGHGVLTGAITLLSPPVGLILVLATNTPAPPSVAAISDKKLIEEKRYIEAYQQEAKKIKKGKALKGFAFGLGAYILILGSIASNS